MESKPMSERSVNETTPLVDAALKAAFSGSGAEIHTRQLQVLDPLARRLERALAVAEGAIRQGERALSYAANRLDAQGTQVQVAGDCAVNAAALQVALAQIEELRK